jgi:hypothetical protein
MFTPIALAVCGFVATVMASTEKGQSIFSPLPKRSLISISTAGLVLILSTSYQIEKSNEATEIQNMVAYDVGFETSKARHILDLWISENYYHDTLDPHSTISKISASSFTTSIASIDEDIEDYRHLVSYKYTKVLRDIRDHLIHISKKAENLDTKQANDQIIRLANLITELCRMQYRPNEAVKSLCNSSKNYYSNGSTISNQKKRNLI